jgi:hypothetical protein
MQETNGSNNELESLSAFKFSMVCKSTQLPPEIWVILFKEAMK